MTLTKHKQKPSSRTVKTAEPEPQMKTLTEQKVDFTAEGAPPPGLVGTGPPDLSGTDSAIARDSAALNAANRRVEVDGPPRSP